MLIGNSLVSVKQIVKPINKSAFLIVTKYLEPKEFTATPISFSVIGIQTVCTAKISDKYSVNISDIKYKCLIIVSYLNCDIF